MRATHKTLGEQLRERRKARTPKLSQEELAERVGLTHGTISRLERGLIKRVSPALLERLAAALDCRPGDLMGAAEAQDPQLDRARQLLSRIAPEDMPGAVKALRGFVRDTEAYPFRADLPALPAKPSRKKKRP